MSSDMKIVGNDRCTDLREELKQVTIKMFTTEGKAQIFLHSIRSGSATSTRVW